MKQRVAIGHLAGLKVLPLSLAPCLALFLVLDAPVFGQVKRGLRG